MVDNVLNNPFILKLGPVTSEIIVYMDDSILKIHVHVGIIDKLTLFW